MIKGFILALQFLTRLPINVAIDFNSENLRRSTFFYPYVGLFLGAIATIPYYLFSPYNKQVSAFMVLLLMIFLTGGLHLDGLSDTADGFFSNRDREGTLEIMKDSRIGAFGVISLILIILFKYILILSLDTNLPVAMALSMGNSRLTTLLQIAFKKNARPGGLGDMIHQAHSKPYIVTTAIIYTLITLGLDLSFIIPLIISLIFGQFISLYSYKKIGGFTGDVYGASIELTEAISLLAFWGVFIWT